MAPKLEISLLQSSQVLKFPKSEMLAPDGIKGTSVLCFLCQRRQKLLGGSGVCSPGKFLKFEHLKSLEMHR